MPSFAKAITRQVTRPGGALRAMVLSLLLCLTLCAGVSVSATTSKNDAPSDDSKASVGAAALMQTAILAQASTLLKDSPPIMYALPELPIAEALDNDGKSYRPILLIADAMFDELGLQWRHLPLPVSRMYKYLDSGRANFSMLIRTERLADCCITSKKPVSYLYLGAYRKPATQPIHSREEMRLKSFITIAGYSYGPLKSFIWDKKNEITLYPAKNHESAFSMLENNRAPYLLNYQGPARKIEEGKNKYGLEYNLIETLDVHLVLNKNYPNAYEVMALLEAAYEKRFNGIIPPH